MQCIFIQVNIIALSYAKHFYPVIKAFLENININNFSPLQLPRFKCKEQELLPFSQYFLFIIMRQVHHKSNRYKLFSGMTDHFPRRLVYVHISRSLSFFTRVSGHINLISISPRYQKPHTDEIHVISEGCREKLQINKQKKNVEMRSYNENGIKR